MNADIARFSDEERQAAYEQVAEAMAALLLRCWLDHQSPAAPDPPPDPTNEAGDA
jgi:hypothetical protein